MLRDCSYCGEEFDDDNVREDSYTDWIPIPTEDGYWDEGYGVVYTYECPHCGRMSR